MDNVQRGAWCQGCGVGEKEVCGVVVWDEGVVCEVSVCVEGDVGRRYVE